MKKLITSCCIAAGLLLPAAISTSLQAEPPMFERHPEIREAIHSLERARDHLMHARHDFGGHREAAVRAIDAAIAQLNAALEYDRH